MALVAASLMLAAGCWFEFGSAGPLAWLAQAPMALGIALLRGTQRGQRLGRDALALGVTWACAFLAALALVAWPLRALLRMPDLLPVLAMSTAGAFLLLLLWRYWPLWHVLERQGGSIGKHFAGLGTHQRSAWSGLQVAVPVWLLLAGGIALGWPGLLSGDARLIAVIAYAVALPLSHALLQTAPSRVLVQGLPVLDMDVEGEVEEDDIEAPIAPLSVMESGTEVDVVALNRDLYAAARAGRVQRALQLLDAGADARAEAPAGDRDRRGLPVLAAVLPDLRLLRMLIERGVDLNSAHGSSMTPLLAATRDSWHGRPEAVMTLLANGADSRAADADGNTPLHHAARSSDPGVAALLLDAGAQVDTVNAEGVSPLGIACAAGNWRLARFLLERGAKAEPAN
ncbi:MAG: ankyrin repeat domain-containing protein, partial [Pseudomonadota bacterium]|nr:ankyrin repeat domain-containing protein [Pseudomonadota bacterium]